LSDQEPLPDFYAILQVHPSAEPEIIEVAYRRLMRKYHPDALSPELKSDPELISRVRWINVAYDVLSDPAQRAAYDETIAAPSLGRVQEIDPEIETRITRNQKRFFYATDDPERFRFFGEKFLSERIEKVQRANLGESENRV